MSSPAIQEIGASTFPIPGSSFTDEQTRFLEDFFAALRTRTPPASAAQTSHIDAAAEVSAPALFHNTPVDDLCREEIWKYEQNPLDLWDKLLAHASEDRAPAPDDLFRFKFHGLFYVAPAQDSFMLRMRVPGGGMTSAQLRGIAQMAEDWGCGRADITTRANLQLREFRPRDIVNVLNRVQSLGMSSRGTGADNIRNITASPTSGIDPAELLDVQPYARALNQYIANSRDLYGLPRKFNVAFDGGGAISVLADTNDIGFLAVRIAEGRDVPAGIYFRVVLCGITGHRQFASDCGILIPPDQAVAVAAAMVRVFSENGDRTDRKRARLKYLIDKWGIARFLDETEKLLPLPLLRFPADQCEPRSPIDRAGHLGVHPQAQPGLSYIGVSIPVGRLPVAQMRALADIADRFGSGELRLTVWQNLILPNLPNENLASAQQALDAAGLSCIAGRALSGTVACTGNQGCRFAATDTKSHAVALANHLDAHFQIVQPINLHVTGCPHSCAQHYIGDIGLLGLKVGGEEGYQVNLGGGADQDQGLAREFISAIRFADLPPVIDRLMKAFAQQRTSDSETFLSFTRRHSIAELRAFAQLPAEEK